MVPLWDFILVQTEKLVLPCTAQQTAPQERTAQQHLRGRILKLQNNPVQLTNFFFSSQRLARAATVIQAFYRGSKERHALKRAELGIILLQRKFRQKRLDKERMKVEEKQREENTLAIEQKRISEFRSSMRKQLKMLESVPAREVNLFMSENQEMAARKIQAAFRGVLGRRKFLERHNEVTRERAAIAIQRQVVYDVKI